MVKAKPRWVTEMPARGEVTKTYSLSDLTIEDMKELLACLKTVSEKTDVGQPRRDALMNEIRTVLALGGDFSG